MSKKLLQKTHKKQNSDRKLAQTLKPSSLDTENALSAEDVRALEEFSATIEFSPIAFETWQNSHEDLDLKIPLFIDALLLNEGGSKQFEYTRTLLSSCQSPKKTIRRKEKHSLTVDIPKGCQLGLVLHFKGLGDVSDSEVGDLFLTIYLKK
ncbi:MAG: hypothetical protein KBD78_17065 [Oligoflexales bacterium]|nr:hypothetical protein [Oligoflexales bacterium]